MRNRPKLNNQRDDIIIGFYIDELGEKKPFSDVIQNNDSLFSPMNSDSIYVIRNGKKRGYKLFLNFGKF
ncbi:hypothetical protein BC643_3997 [Mangrovibacterium diazotrophicum]|uniref:Uncharacterized protein n=1 Tax=Mangrovibacterium diazotrophicum TaxID=1261403 RepID=A0A419VW57_9BACT|nr:hypothetical protein BC643_3997 [Mangrovibacterium diazotrophicum]